MISGLGLESAKVIGPLKGDNLISAGFSIMFSCVDLGAKTCESCQYVWQTLIYEEVFHAK